MNTTSSRVRFLLAACGTTLAASGALADTWDNSAGTAQWSTATNWADNTEPTNADVAIFPGVIPLNQATILMTTTEFCSSLDFDNDYTLQGGQMFVINGGVDVASGRTATINTVINGSQGLTKTGSGTLRLLPVSSNSFSGLISITGFGSTLYVRSNVVLGNTANDITISGGRLILDGITNPTFLITGRTITAGALGATIELQNNAFLDLIPALGPGSNPITFTGSGTVELGGGSTRTGSTFVSVPLIRLNSANALGTPGSASLSNGVTLEINNGSGTFASTVFTASGNTIRGGTGTHTFNGFCDAGPGIILNGGPASSDRLILGSNGASVWNNGGSGTTLVNVGTVELAAANNYTGGWSVNSTLQINHPGALGTGTTPVIVNSSGRLKLNTPTLARDITLNNPGGGIELLQDAVVSGNIPIAPNAGFVPILGPAHEFTLSGAGSSMTYTGVAYFGGAIGVGSMHVTGGADVTGTSTRVFGPSGGSAHLSVSGAGSSWQNTGEMWFGNSGGTGTLRVEAGGSLSCPRVYVAQGEDASAFVTGEASLLTSADLLVVGFGSVVGTLNVLDGADVVAGTVRIGELTGASGSATIHGAGSTLTSQGPLEVGITGTGNLVMFNGGEVACLGLNLGDGAASSGTCTVSGGPSRLTCGSAGVLMSENGATSTLNLFTGIVDIHGDITDAGAGQSTFTLDGATLDMHGFAIGAGASPIDIPAFRSGTLKNVSQINNGSGFNKDGPGTLFLDTVNTYTGATTVSEGTLYLVDATGSNTGNGMVVVGNLGTLAGNGRAAGAVLNDGVVSPQGFNFASTATLHMLDSYAQLADGSLNIQIDTGGAHDSIIVTAQAVLTGTLNVSLLNGYMPAPGDSFTILTAASISGQFPTTNLPPLSSGLAWQVEYAADHVRLRVGLACVADVDDGSNTGTPDGGVDISDLLYYLALLDSGDPAADVDDGSATGTPDGGVDISDLLYFLARFDAGC